MDFVDFFRAPVPSLKERRMTFLHELCEKRGIISVKDCESAGIGRRVLHQAVKDGEFVQVSRGWYRSRHVDASHGFSAEVLQVAYRVRDAIFCGPSAAAYWGLTKRRAEKLWVAIPRGRWKPKFDFVRWVTWGTDRKYCQHFSNAGRLPFMVTHPERCVVELVAYRDELGMDMARDAMRKVIADPFGSYMAMVCIAEEYRCAKLVHRLWADCIDEGIETATNDSEG